MQWFRGRSEDPCRPVVCMPWTEEGNRTVGPGDNRTSQPAKDNKKIFNKPDHASSQSKGPRTVSLLSMKVEVEQSGRSNFCLSLKASPSPCPSVHTHSVLCAELPA